MPKRTSPESVVSEILNGEDRYLDTETPAVDILNSIMTGINAASILKAASDLKIFDSLEKNDGSWTAEELSKANGYHTGFTERFLNTLTAMKLVNCKENGHGGYQYSNSDAGRLLVTTNPDTLKEIISWISCFNDGLNNLPNIVKKGPSAVYRCDSEEANPDFSIEKEDLDNMNKCKHGNLHDEQGNVYDEDGKLVHGLGSHSHDDKEKTKEKTTMNAMKDNTKLKSREAMEECKHGNFHDKSGNVYDEHGELLHGPGGHGDRDASGNVVSGPGEHEEHMNETTEGNGDEWDEYPFYQGMHNLLGSSAAKLMTTIDLSEHKSAVDLGGGSGILCFELKRQYPEMNVTLFELEGIVKLFKEHFLPGNESLGVKTIAGNWNQNPLPKADLYLLSQVIHDIKNPEDLLQKIYNSINPGGALLMLEQTLADDKISVSSSAVWDLVMMTHGGILRSPKEFRHFLKNVGFTGITIIRTQLHNEYDVIYARKPEHPEKKKTRK